MQSVLKGLSAKPTTLKFVTGESLQGVSGLTSLAADGIQEAMEQIQGLTGFNTSSVTGEGFYLFFHSCSSLRTVDVSSFDISNATALFSFFYDCSGLTSITGLENFNTSKVTSYNYMFQNCSSLTTLDLSSFTLPGGSIWIGAMFTDCTNLKTIYATSNFDLSTSSAATTDIFSGCTSLEGGNGTKYSADNVEATYARIDTAATPGYFTEK